MLDQLTILNKSKPQALNVISNGLESMPDQNLAENEINNILNNLKSRQRRNSNLKNQNYHQLNININNDNNNNNHFQKRHHHSSSSSSVTSSSSMIST